MKAFIYQKKGNALVAVITNVVKVFDDEEEITFVADDGTTYNFDKRKLKTTTYQN